MGVGTTLLAMTNRPGLLHGDQHADHVLPDFYFHPGQRLRCQDKEVA